MAGEDVFSPVTWFEFIFPAQLTAITIVDDVPVYDFFEQTYDSATGDIEYAIGGRSGSAEQGNGATEINGNLLAVPCFAWIRFNTMAGGQGQYECFAEQNLWVQLTNTIIPAAITSTGSQTVYPQDMTGIWVGPSYISGDGTANVETITITSVTLIGTTVLASIASGSGVTVTPESMTNITTSTWLLVESFSDGNSEFVKPSATASTTFTATFADEHEGPVKVTGGSFVADFTKTHLADVTVTADASGAAYPGVLYYFFPQDTAGDFDFMEMMGVWVQDVNELALVVGDYYQGETAGVDSTDGHPIVNVRSYEGGGGGGSDIWGAITYTSVAASVSSGTHTITPASMDGIFNGAKFYFDTGVTNQEIITASSCTGSTFSATFANSHSAGSWMAGAPTTVDGVSYYWPGTINTESGAANDMTFVQNTWILEPNGIPPAPGVFYNVVLADGNAGDGMIVYGITDTIPMFPVQITAVTGTAPHKYTWLEQTDGYSNLPAGRCGSSSTNPLEEINNKGLLSASLPVYALAKFRELLSGEFIYEFDAGQSPGTIEVELNGSEVGIEPIINIVNTCLSTVVVTVVDDPTNNRITITIKDPPMTQLTVVTAFDPTTCVVTTHTICVPTAFIDATCPSC